MIYYCLWFIFLHPKIDALFLPFFRISKSEFLIQDLIFRLTVNENGISTHQNLSLGVDNQILKIEDVAIVPWLVKHFAFFYSRNFTFNCRVAFAH